MKSFKKMHAEEKCTEEICDGVKYGPAKLDLGYSALAGNVFLVFSKSTLANLGPDSSDKKKR
jgi:hypothetical protein